MENDTKSHLKLAALTDITVNLPRENYTKEDLGYDCTGNHHTKGRNGDDEQPPLHLPQSRRSSTATGLVRLVGDGRPEKAPKKLEKALFPNRI